MENPDAFSTLQNWLMTTGVGVLNQNNSYELERDLEIMQFYLLTHSGYIGTCGISCTRLVASRRVASR